MDIPDAKLLGELMDALVARNVLVFKAGDIAIQFAPPQPSFDEPEVSREVQAGGWKRPADLESGEEPFDG